MGFGEIGEQLRRSTVQIRASGARNEGSGSGIIWESDGLILTNNHVAQSDAVEVELWDGRKFPGEVKTRDRRRDLAAIRISRPGLIAVTIGDSSRLRVGELVVAVGNPLGFVGALTTVIIHSVGPLQGFGRQDWVKADIRLAPGNSGGPLADVHGQVIGINTMIAGVRHPFVLGKSGVGLAVPSNAVSKFLSGGSSGASLGIVVRPVRLPGSKTIGLLVLEIVRGGAAEAASLLLGDVLTAVNGQPFRSSEELSDALDQPSNASITLRFRRGDRKADREVTVSLAARKAEAA